MTPVKWLSRLFFPKKSEFTDRVMLPIEEQIKAWRGANKEMKWHIGEKEFNGIGAPPSLTNSDLEQGFVGVALFYGVGDDGSGHADSVLSGKIAWDCALKRLKNKVWQSPHINFDKPDYFRLRPGAPPRPQGFYFGKIQTGERFQRMTVSQVRTYFNSVTGCGLEGLQFLCITHTHIPDMMSERKLPFMILADYDFAPYGHDDFFDTLQIFSSNRILGLGIGNVDQNYPGFSIPTIIIAGKAQDSG
ncbi:MAG: hypothetical protein ACHQ0Y_04770 [Thermodesulfovibrionales bacterium]